MGKPTEDPGKDWPQIFAICVACIPGLSSALLLSWPSPFILVLLDKENYHISEDEANTLPILLPVALMLSSMFFFKIHDVIGRKYTLLLLNVPQIAFWIITIFAKDIYAFYIARIISGIADGLMYAALPIYLGEISTPRIRGTWGTGQAFSFNAGFFLINILGLYFTIKETALICITLPILSAILFIWMPESPYYYIRKGQDEKAKASLQWLLRKRNIDPDFVQLKADVYRQMSEAGTWADLFRIKSNRKALIAAIFIRFVQQFAGIVVFETYIQFIFKKAGTTTFSPEDSSIIFSGLLWIVMFIFTFFLDKVGRRKSMIYSSLGCSIVLLAESIYFYVDQFQKEIDLSNVSWFPIVGLGTYILVYSAGLGPLPSLMAGELFSASIKGKALAVATGALGFITFLSTLMFKTLNSAVGLYAPFAIFAFFTFIGFILSFYVVPETKGRTLEEIQQDLKGNNEPKKPNMKTKF